MQSSVKFSIDTNALLTPYHQYYAPDILPSFWKEIEKNSRAGAIVVLDMVKNELEKGSEDDWLKKWVETLTEEQVIKHSDGKIINQYSKIVRYLQEAEYYKPEALKNWSDRVVADPWLIAAGMAYGYKIITLEKPSGQLNKNQPSKNAKIPDVCKYFGVKYGSLNDMIRELDFQLCAK